MAMDAHGRQIVQPAQGDQLDAWAVASEVSRRRVRGTRWAPAEGVPVTVPLISGEPLLRAVDVAALLSVPTKRVYELGIPAVRLSQRCLRWRRADVERWLEGRRVVP
jgi:predicted DNA-binding transcriptional regulator AlpA